MDTEYKEIEYVLYTTDYNYKTGIITPDYALCSLKYEDEAYRSYYPDELYAIDSQIHCFTVPNVSWITFNCTNDLKATLISYDIIDMNSFTDRLCKIYLKFGNKISTTYILFKQVLYMQQYILYWAIFIDIQSVPAGHSIGLWQYDDNSYSISTYLSYISNNLYTFTINPGKKLAVLLLRYDFYDSNISNGDYSKITAILLNTSNIILSYYCSTPTLVNVDKQHSTIISTYFGLPTDFENNDDILLLIYNNLLLSSNPHNNKQDYFPLWTTTTREENVYFVQVKYSAETITPNLHTLQEGSYNSPHIILINQTTNKVVYAYNTNS